MFEIGAEYRRRDLHAKYGGQTRQGISTPADSNLIFLITGKSGARYGYDDGWEPEGVYRYYGTGTTGPMRMEGADERVRDHAEDGSELHLFEDLDNGFLRYMDEMVLAGWTHKENVPGKDRKPRRASSSTSPRSARSRWPSRHPRSRSRRLAASGACRWKT